MTSSIVMIWHFLEICKHMCPSPNVYLSMHTHPNTHPSTTNPRIVTSFLVTTFNLLAYLHYTFDANNK